MFCPKCGSKVPDGSTTCPNCEADLSSILKAQNGRKPNPAENSTPNESVHQASSHEETKSQQFNASSTANVSSSADSVRDKLTESLTKADRICNEAYPFFERASNIRYDAEEKAAKSKKRFKILLVVVGLLALSFIQTSLTYMSEAPLISFILIIISIAMVVLVFVSKGKADDRVYTLKESADNEDAKGTEILNTNADTLSIIPDDYWYPLATNYMLKVVRTGRANTVNEALLMFDEQLHRWKMEDSNASILAQQQAQTEALNGIRKSNAINATANVVNAAANITRLFK